MPPAKPKATHGRSLAKAEGTRRADLQFHFARGASLLVSFWILILIYFFAFFNLGSHLVHIPWILVLACLPAGRDLSPHSSLILNLFTASVIKNTIIPVRMSVSFQMAFNPTPFIITDFTIE